MPDDPARAHTTAVRVRYPECDPQGVAHHAAYPVWLEVARTEALRDAGHAYRDLEARGVLLVVAKLSVRYRRPARYDDVVTVACATQPTRGGTLVHAYRLTRGDELLAEAETTLVCVNAEGEMQRMPAELLA